MKKLLAGLLMSVAGMSAHGGEWVPYVYQAPVMVQPAPVVAVPYYYAPMVTMVPMAPQYVPVTLYQNVLVERRCWTLLKKTEVVSVPQTVYVPVRY